MRASWSSRTPLIRVLAALALGGPSVMASVSNAEPDESEAARLWAREESVEAYLERLQLGDLHVEQLERRLKEARRDDRLGIAERLARAYVRQLERAQTPEQAQVWEERSRTLLAGVPEAESFELRVNLNRAVYLRAEAAAERHRLRLSTPEESARAYESLRTIAQQSRELALKVHQRVLQLERLETNLDGTEALQRELAEARRLRSLAFYYSGWAAVYAGELSPREAGNLAFEASKDFGWLLNSSGSRPATVDRATPEMMKYEHVARAALGCAMAASLRSSDVEALRWLELIDHSEEVPATVREQIAARRFVIYGAAKRWADLDRVVRLAKRKQVSGKPDEVVALPVASARLLAVITLEADRRVAAPQIEALARTALADLVAQKQTEQVLDLVRRYGTAPLGDTGFIVHYVRGLQQYEQARTLGPEPDPAEPGEAELPLSPEAANAFRAAASLLNAALEQDDAGSFGVERLRAAVALARALARVGEIEPAAQRLAEAFGAAPSGEQGEEALWLAINLYDRLIRESGRTEARVARRDELIAIYLKTFPESERAVRLVLLRASEGSLGDEEALKVLGQVAKDSPVYEAARRQIARILFSRLRAASGAEQREFAATSFLAVAEQVLGWDIRDGREGDASRGKAIAERIVGRTRQMLDALLITRTPNPKRAEELIAVFEIAGRDAGLEASKREGEVLLRKVQVALARGELVQASDFAERLSSADPSREFIALADRAIYRQLIVSAAGSEKPEETGATWTDERARVMVRVAIRMIDRLKGDELRDGDRGALALHLQLASAATHEWKRTADPAMRDLALRADSAVLLTSPRMGESLRRVAELAESAGDWTRARASWVTLAELSQSGSEAWFEARFNVIRLLSNSDPVACRAMIEQQRSLFPDLAPAPWGEQIRGIESGLPAGPSSPTGETSEAPR